jgi:hypothetical protein
MEIAGFSTAKLLHMLGIQTIDPAERQIRCYCGQAHGTWHRKIASMENCTASAGWAGSQFSEFPMIFQVLA